MKNIYADSAYVLVLSFLAYLDEYQPRKCINGELGTTNKRAFYASQYTKRLNVSFSSMS